MISWLAVLLPLFGHLITGTAILSQAAGGGPASAGSPPAPPAQPGATGPPRAALTFSPGIQRYKLSLDITMADGKARSTPELQIHVFASEDARDVVFQCLRDVPWAVETAGRDILVIRGVKKIDGTIVAITSCKLTVRGEGQAKPALTGLNGVTVENAR